MLCGINNADNTSIPFIVTNNGSIAPAVNIANGSWCTATGIYFANGSVD